MLRRLHGNITIILGLGMLYMDIYCIPFSVGDASDIEVSEDDSFTFEDTESKES